MRKVFTKEVTLTTVRIGKFEFENGVKEGTLKAVELKPEILLGNITKEKAQKLMDTKHKKSVTVLDVTTETNLYEMSVTSFIKHAKIKEDQKEGETK